MAESEWGYMIRTDGKIPVLVRYKAGEVYTYCPETPEVWKRSRTKDSILYGGGDFVWYDDITPEEAEAYMPKIAKLRGAG